MRADIEQDPTPSTTPGVNNSPGHVFSWGSWEIRCLSAQHQLWYRLPPTSLPTTLGRKLKVFWCQRCVRGFWPVKIDAGASSEPFRALGIECGRDCMKRFRGRPQDFDGTLRTCLHECCAPTTLRASPHYIDLICVSTIFNYTQAGYMLWTREVPFFKNCIPKS